MGQTAAMVRLLDHLVLPIADLDAARTRLDRLGFTVAPRGIHPFGTGNCCVYFADGTFIEPLVVVDEHAAEAAVKSGNVFVSRDRSYRQAFGPEGFSAVVFAGDNADDEHRAYVEAGISAGDRLDFSRPFIDATGRSDTASFRLAFAALPETHGTYVFTCQRVNSPKVDRSALEQHENGVTRICEIIAVSDDPARAAGFLRLSAGYYRSGTSDSTVPDLPNARLSVLTGGQYAEKTGLAPRGHGLLSFEAVVFCVRDIEALRRGLVSRGIDHDIREGQVVVAPAPGQGATFIFQESA
ncbi:VOC family protein [Aquamicrobium lusatiense]|uniref:VOC family protein n=1 Tax=Aquamicrobium lusatiense TaxID=89772 RepID=UPI002457FB74|nr:VOC family protein [Aquamicrobium lusatiense]MDH4990298.1 VOC family protein [Aquamicrobium lusatiense]